MAPHPTHPPATAPGPAAPPALLPPAAAPSSAPGRTRDATAGRFPVRECPTDGTGRGASRTVGRMTSGAWDRTTVGPYRLLSRLGEGGMGVAPTIGSAMNAATFSAPS